MLWWARGGVDLLITTRCGLRDETRSSSRLSFPATLGYLGTNWIAQRGVLALESATSCTVQYSQRSCRFRRITQTTTPIRNPSSDLRSVFLYACLMRLCSYSSAPAFADSVAYFTPNPGRLTLVDGLNRNSVLTMVNPTRSRPRQFSYSTRN